MASNINGGVTLNGVRVVGSDDAPHPHAYAIDLSAGTDRMVVTVPDGHRIYASWRVRPDVCLPLYPWPLGCISDEFSNKERTDNVGTDCTMALEIYDKGFCKWYCAEAIDVGRDYELFGLLAGVRGTELDCQIDPRGLPGDGSKEIIVSSRGYSYHTPSFIYGDELLKMTGRNVKKRLSKILRALKRYPGQPPERMRIVFWFDS